MRHFYTFITLFCFVNVVLQAQSDVVYNFDSDTESWVRIHPTTTIMVSQSSGNLVIGGNINNFGGVASPVLTELSLSRDDYDFVIISMKNETSITRFRLLSYVEGGIDGTTSNKTPFDVPAGSDFNTYSVVMPLSPNGEGTVTRIGIGVTGDPADGESFSINTITIRRNRPATLSGFVENPSFEDIPGGIENWSLAPRMTNKISVELSNDANEGSQAVKYNFSEVETNAHPLWNGYRHTLDPALDRNTMVTVSWDMKKSDNMTTVKISPRWRMKITGSTGDQIVFGAPQTATDSYANYSITRAISDSDGETYDNIELGLAARDGASGVSLLVDNVITFLEGGLLGFEEVSLINNDLDISLFPNPVSDFLTVEGISNIIKMKVIDLLGQVKIIQIGNSNTINVSKLKQGNYVIKVVQGDGSVSSKLFVKI